MEDTFKPTQTLLQYTLQAGVWAWTPNTRKKKDVATLFTNNMQKGSSSPETHSPVPLRKTKLRSLGCNQSMAAILGWVHVPDKMKYTYDADSLEPTEDCFRFQDMKL